MAIHQKDNTAREPDVKIERPEPDLSRRDLLRICVFGPGIAAALKACTAPLGPMATVEASGFRGRDGHWYELVTDQAKLKEIESGKVSPEDVIRRGEKVFLRTAESNEDGKFSIADIERLD